MLNGTLESRDCGVRVALGAETQHLERYYAKATRYTLVISVLTFVQVCLGAASPGARLACARPLNLRSSRVCVWGVSRVCVGGDGSASAVRQDSAADAEWVSAGDRSGRSLDRARSQYPSGCSAC